MLTAFQRTRLTEPPISEAVQLITGGIATNLGRMFHHFPYTNIESVLKQAKHFSAQTHYLSYSSSTSHFTEY